MREARAGKSVVSLAAGLLVTRLLDRGFGREWDLKSFEGSKK
jgi:hypothetical protein